MLVLLLAHCQLGEEPHHKAIATAIDRARRTRPLQTTLELADVIASAVPPSYSSSARGRAGMVGPRRIHAATRTFQALRIFVNREVRPPARALSAHASLTRTGASASANGIAECAQLMELSEGLKQSERLLPPGGTLAGTRPGAAPEQLRGC